MSEKETSSRGFVIALAIAVVGLGLWWTFRDRGEARDAEVTEVEVPAEEDRPRDRFDGNDWRDVHPPARRPTSAERETALLTGTPQANAPRYPSGRLVGARDVYRVMSTYPLDSRPLEADRHHDLIDWNRPQTASNPVEGDEQGTTYLYSADVSWVMGEGQVRTFLQVSRDDQPVEAEVLQAWVAPNARRGEELTVTQRQPVRLEYSNEGDRLVHELRPATAFPTVPSRSIDLVFVIEFTFDGAERPVRATTSALWTPPGAEPARFTGTFRDVVENGSLAIYVGVEVTDPGFYNVDANLWGGEEDPVAWTKWRGDLQAGAHEVRLEFFGKAIVDSGASGPYRLEQLRGFRYAEEISPAVQPMNAYAGAYTCTSTSGFSDAEWNDPLRDERLAELERVESLGGTPPPVPLESFLGNLPPAQRAREAEALGVDPNDFTAEALSRIELEPERPEM
ncbi:MAG: hypothetical protein KC586_18600 [Myxococcales bacterium]|nr:hypothetical protein [Myxococcales bacterium]